MLGRKRLKFGNWHDSGVMSGTEILDSKRIKNPSTMIHCSHYLWCNSLAGKLLFLFFMILGLRVQFCDVPFCFVSCCGSTVDTVW